MREKMDQGNFDVKGERKWILVDWKSITYTFWKKKFDLSLPYLKGEGSVHFV